MEAKGLLASDVTLDHRAQEIGDRLRRLDRRDWSLWCTTILVILLLTGAVLALSLPTLFREDGPFFRFNLNQSVRSLVGLVLLFNLYAVYQQIQIKQVHRQLREQIRIAAQQQIRAEEFFKLAVLDPLTGLHNRRFAEQCLETEIARAQRHNHPLTLMVLDLDDFKQVNDRYGHSVGDSVLKVFAERLKRAVRGSDLAARIGGDEFLAVLPECESGQVQHVIARLTPLEAGLNGERVSVTFSAGWTDYRSGESPDQLFHRADQTLYTNKRSHRKHESVVE